MSQASDRSAFALASKPTVAPRPSLEGRHTVWFTEIGKDDVRFAGGKGANLGELAKAGASVQVPPGFVVTPLAHKQFMDGLPKALREKIESLNGFDHNTQEQAILALSDEIRREIEEQPLPTILRSVIGNSYERLSIQEGETVEVAVRSAALPEDGADASFAGQQGTFLHVKGVENVLRATVADWATCFEGRSVIYRMDLREKILARADAATSDTRKQQLLEYADGLLHQNFSMAVVVQKMANPHVAGVMLMVDAAGSDAEHITIDAVFGLGEGAVGGEISPDSFKFRKDTLELVEEIHNEQTEVYIKNPSGDGSPENSSIKVSMQEAGMAHLVNAPKLTVGQARAIARIGLEIEAHYGVPQDIEWVGVEEGPAGWLEFKITQTRPITVKKLALAGNPMPSVQLRLLGTGTPASPKVVFGHIRKVIGDPKKDPSILDKVQPGDVMVAEFTTPDFVPAMKRAAALLTKRGGRTSHAAIVGREMGLGVIVGVENALDLPDGTPVTVNSKTGEIWEGHAPNLLDWWAEELKVKKDNRASGRPILTRTHVCVNQADPEDALRNIADGMNFGGNTLARMEFKWAELDMHPEQYLEEGRRQEAVDALVEMLCAHGKAFWPNSVTTRLNDLKTHEMGNLGKGQGWKYEEQYKCENPQDGFRGCARYLKVPEVLRMEVEAVLIARKRGWTNIQIMLPYVRTTMEYAAVLDLMASFEFQGEAEGLRCVRGENDLKIIMMAELPVNVLRLDDFMELGMDGVSVGSNDLDSKVHGLCRDWEGAAQYGDTPVEPVMMDLYQMVGEKAHARGLTYIALCGQAVAFYPELSQKLVEWHYTHIGTAPDGFDATLQYVAEAEAKLAGMSFDDYQDMLYAELEPAA